MSEANANATELTRALVQETIDKCVEMIEARVAPAWNEQDESKRREILDDCGIALEILCRVHEAI